MGIPGTLPADSSAPAEFRIAPFEASFADFSSSSKVSDRVSNARERDALRQRPQILGRFELESAHHGARAGSRTLNLGIRGCRHAVSRSVSECQRVPNEVARLTHQCQGVQHSVSECHRQGVN